MGCALMRKLLGAVGVLVVLVALGVVLFLHGQLRLNHPDEQRFPIRGIDVSHHQGAIDWMEVGRGGVVFAYLKATEGGDWVDERFVENWRKSKAAGIVRGAYHFFTFCQTAENQANNFMAHVAREPGMLPPVVDVETVGNCAMPYGKDRLVAEIRAFSSLLRQRYGVLPVLYTTQSFWSRYLQGSSLENPVWMRDIIFEPGEFDGRPWLFWQYHDREPVPGIAGLVDVDVFNGGEEAFTRILLQ